jgi:hypothetical protein
MLKFTNPLVPGKKRKKNTHKPTERENFQNGQNHRKALETDEIFFPSSLGVVGVHGELET